MKLDEMIRALRDELDQVTAAIEALEALLAAEKRSDRATAELGHMPRRRGRPPGSKNKKRASSTSETGPNGSP